MPKLLILTSSFPRRPEDFAGCFVEEFAQALSSDFEVEILSPPSDGAPAQEQRGRLRVHRFNYFWPRSAQLLDAAADLQPLLERSLRARLQTIPFFISFFFRALLLARSADIICSHWLVPAGLVGGLVARVLGKPHIAIEHSGAIHLLRKLGFGRRLMQFITRNATRLIVVSDRLREQIVALCPAAAAKVDVVPMGIEYGAYDCRAVEPRSEGAKKTILFLGRLTPVKGVNILLDALAGSSDLQLIIAGDGEQRAELEQRARFLGVPARFLGLVGGEQKRQLLQACDLVVIPSIVLPDGRTEGTPIVCLEAFAAAKAVIASAVGGLCELIIDGESGLLCEPGNCAQLREKIFALLEDDLRRAAIGSRAAQVAAEYDWSKISARFKSLVYLK